MMGGSTGSSSSTDCSVFSGQPPRLQNRETLVYQGASILCLDCPTTNFHFGIDQHFWAVGDRFKGVKFIPPGIHFIYYSCAGGDFVQRLGFFQVLKPGEVIVRRYHPETETLIELQDKDEESRYIAGVKRWDFDLGMGEYPVVYDEKGNIDAGLDDYATVVSSSSTPTMPSSPTPGSNSGSNPYASWLALTKHISIPVVKKVTNGNTVGSKSLPCTEAEKVKSKTNYSEETKNTDVTTAEEKDKNESEGETSKNSGFETLSFSTLPNNENLKQWLSGLSPQEITNICYDKSSLVEKVLEAEYKVSKSRGIATKDRIYYLLGEFELGFLAFLLGQNYDGFSHWKELLLLFSSCDRLVEKNPDFYTAFLKSLMVQIRYAPDDFFNDELLNGDDKDVSSKKPNPAESSIGNQKNPIGNLHCVKNNFLMTCLGQLLELTADHPNKDLAFQCEGLKELVQLKFGVKWSDLIVMGCGGPTVMDDDYDDDDFPTIVEEIPNYQNGNNQDGPTIVEIA